MDSTIVGTLIVAGFALVGTIISAKFVSNVEVVKLQMRMKALEDKVMTHNNLIERTYVLEKKVDLLEHYVEHK
ncbi:MAG: hypothetical protein PHI67_07130 [Candidatus Methanomethylophilaceae archaeon]|nr:hypothetical protein [Candidatus Methanomethylophilaceae archaeon]